MTPEDFLFALDEAIPFLVENGEQALLFEHDYFTPEDVENFVDWVYALKEKKSAFRAKGFVRPEAIMIITPEE